MAMLCVVLAGMGLLELATSSLSDAGETDRHLFLFHVITDFTILLAACGAGNFACSRLSSRRYAKALIGAG